MKIIKGTYNTAVIYTDNIEPTCEEQLRSMMNCYSFRGGQICIMPDTHAGKGSVVGFTYRDFQRIVPNTIGVDIGCGIYAYKLSGAPEDIWENIDAKIRSVVPLGMEIHKQSTLNFGPITPLCSKIDINESRAQLSIGTLGGGNHFIEIAKSEKDGSYWLLIHSGSRNLGKRVCDYWQKIAIKERDKRKKTLLDFVHATVGNKSKELAIETIRQYGPVNIPDEMCYLEGEQMKEYLADMQIAQNYAHYNRETMAERITNILEVSITDRIFSVHNYIDLSDNTIRKGAIRANKGQRLVVPFNMLAGTIIGIGKGTNEWNNSAPHGAGRRMSRTEAKKQVTLAQFRDVMKPVWSSSVNQATIDESPFAYKEPSEIVDNITETVEIIDRLIPVYNLKDSDYKGD